MRKTAELSSGKGACPSRQTVSGGDTYGGAGDAAPEGALQLPSVDAVDALPQEALPGLVAALAALQARAAARMVAPTHGRFREAVEDELLTVSEVAEQLRTTEDWLYRHANRLPFTVRVGRGQLRFSARGLSEWVTTRRKTY